MGRSVCLSAKKGQNMDILQDKVPFIGYREMGKAEARWQPLRCVPRGYLCLRSSCIVGGSN